MALNCLTKLFIRNLNVCKMNLLGNPMKFQHFRGIRNWQIKTLRLMYHRKRLLDTVEPKPVVRSEFQDWNYNTELFAFNQRLNEKFNESNLRTAFTNKSYIEKEEIRRRELGIVEVEIGMKDNSLFAQEGEKLMYSYIKKYLRYFLPKVPEDGIRSFCDYLLSEPVLFDIGNWIGCKELILCNEYPPSPSSTANTVKALVGSLQQDAGEKHAEKFILDFIITYLADKDLMDLWDVENPESILQKILQRERLPDAEPRIIGESAKGTLEACYFVGLYVHKQLIGSSPGETLKIAREMAALDALRNIFELKPSQVNFLFGEKGYNINLENFQQENLYLKEWAPSLVKKNRVELINNLKN